MTRQLTSAEVKKFVERRFGFVTRSPAKWVVLAKDFNDAYAQGDAAAVADVVNLHERPAIGRPPGACKTGDSVFMNHNGVMHVDCGTCGAKGKGATLDEAMAAMTCAR